MLREEWENSEDAESILFIYNHATGEVSSEVFSGYECGLKARDRRNELVGAFPSCSFSIIDNELATDEWLAVMLLDFYEEMGQDEEELDDHEDNFS